MSVTEVKPMTAEEVQSKIESNENHIKQIKETYNGSVRFLNLCLYDLKYLPKVRVPSASKNMMGMIVHKATFTCIM